MALSTAPVGRKRARSKQVAVQFSFGLMLVALFIRSLKTVDIVIPGLHTREEYIIASMAHSNTKFAPQRGGEYYQDDTGIREAFVSTNYTLAQHEESYWMRNLDIVKPVQCGANKCFFELKGNPNMGYLMSPQKFRFEHRKGSDEVFKTLEASFHFAENLRREYGVKHFLMEPPTNVSVSDDLATFLNSNLWSEARQKRVEKTRFKKGKLSFAQKVIKAPKPALLFGCTASKRGLFFNRVEEFAKHIEDQATFARDFTANMTSMKKLLAAETCLFIDFHALIDTSGQIYHLDFDRCFSNQKLGEKREHKPSQSCMRVIVKVEEKVRKLLEDRKGA